MAKLKLIGAETYISKPRGIEAPVKAGDIVEVDDEHVEPLLAMTYRMDRHEYPVFSTDLNAEVNTKNRRAIPLEQRLQRDREEAERLAELAREREEKEAALSREAELRERVDRLEAFILNNGEGNDGGNDGGSDGEEKPKKTPRKRAATKTAA